MYLEKISIALKAGETAEIRQITQEALDSGVTAKEILNGALIPAMDEVGDKFRGSEIFIPEVLKCARAMHGALRILQGPLSEGEKGGTVKVLIGTVAGDLHDIGKKIVALFLEAKGYEIINLGIDVPVEEFVWAVRKHKPQVLALSALLTTTMGAMKDTIEGLKEAGLRDKVKIIVGGGPVTQQFAEEIGADGFAYDAASAVEWVSEKFPL